MSSSSRTGSSSFKPVHETSESSLSIARVAQNCRMARAHTLLVPHKDTIYLQDHPTVVRQRQERSAPTAGQLHFARDLVTKFAASEVGTPTPNHSHPYQGLVLAAGSFCHQPSCWHSWVSAPSASDKHPAKITGPRFCRCAFYLAVPTGSNSTRCALVKPSSHAGFYVLRWYVIVDGRATHVAKEKDCMRLG